MRNSSRRIRRDRSLRTLSSLPPIDSTLSSWQAVAEQQEWSGLLVGNGASRAVWEQFEYGSLLEVAKIPELDEGSLKPESLRVFESLCTFNFEAVLRALATTSTV